MTYGQKKEDKFWLGRKRNQEGNRKHDGVVEEGGKSISPKRDVIIE